MMEMVVMMMMIVVMMLLMMMILMILMMFLRRFCDEVYHEVYDEVFGYYHWFWLLRSDSETTKAWDDTRWWLWWRHLSSLKPSDCLAPGIQRLHLVPLLQASSKRQDTAKLDHQFILSGREWKCPLWKKMTVVTIASDFGYFRQGTGLTSKNLAMRLTTSSPNLFTSKFERKVDIVCIIS